MHGRLLPGKQDSGTSAAHAQPPYTVPCTWLDCTESKARILNDTFLKVIIHLYYSLDTSCARDFGIQQFNILNFSRYYLFPHLQK